VTNLPLAQIVAPPPTGDRGWEEWLFYHQQDHLVIVQTIQKLRGVVLPTYVIDPLEPNDFKGWALRHQNFHNDMNGVLGLDGTDLQEVDFNKPDEKDSWMWQNFSEHRSAHFALGGAI
jgi:hypothetical protein